MFKYLCNLVAMKLSFVQYIYLLDKIESTHRELGFLPPAIIVFFAKNLYHTYIQNTTQNHTN